MFKAPKDRNTRSPFIGLLCPVKGSSQNENDCYLWTMGTFQTESLVKFGIHKGMDVGEADFFRDFPLQSGWSVVMGGKPQNVR
jgi:hypothetical protein